MEDYILDAGSCTRDELRSKLIAVNTYAFAKKVLEQGGSLDQFEEIVRVYLRKAKELEIFIPRGGCLDLDDL